jgi:splicing suppressor protein 51
MFAGAVSPDLKPLADCALSGGVLVAATQKATTPMTIIAALEAVFSDISTRQTINIHLIGATAAELDCLMSFEEILHLLPSMQEIHCSFVGIELPRITDGNGRILFDCCPRCVAAKRKRSLEMWRGAYHDYIKTDMYVKPDLAVAFHTGHTMEAVKEWKPTIDHLVDAEHCTLFTTFNEDELLEEMEAMKKLGAIFIREGEKNKWKGMKPHLEGMEVEEDMVYYYNQYWYIVAGRRAK